MRFQPRFAILVIAAALALGGCKEDDANQPAARPPADSQTQPATSTAPATQPAAPSVVQQTVTGDGTVMAKLSNGLTVILKATRSNPVVCVRAYVRAGGLYEGKWLGTGVSHLTEHLVAKGAVHDMGAGATASEAKQTSNRVTDIGGQSNAHTSLSYTCYYISAAATKTDDCIDLVADWMARPEILPEDFQREHGVVQRELEMGKDSPSRQLWQAHMANAFAGHPAAVPIIGYAEPLSKLRRTDVLDYHKRMNVPQNMVFCVVGDIDVSAALERICRAFAGFPAGRIPDLSLPTVKPIWSVRRDLCPNSAIKDVLQNISFQTVPLLHDQLYPLDVLSYILTQGRASKLVKQIVRDKKLALSIDSVSWTPAWGKGVFTISFRSEPAKADQAERAILEELKKIITDGVTDEQLQRAKRQKIADLVYSQQSVESIAAQLASDYLSTGDVGFSKDYTQRIQAVTGEQVQLAAEKYFTFDRMAITRMVPAGESAGPTATQQATVEQTSALFTLPNGLRVVLVPDNSVGLVAMAFASSGGVLVETPETNGLGTFMTSMTTEGAADRTAEQIARFFDRSGGAIGGNCGNNTFYWKATVLKDSFAEAMEIFADVIQRPTFPAEKLEVLRPPLLASVDKVDEHWSSQLQKFFRGKFFTNSPYGMLTVGSKDVLGDATAEQLAAYHAKHILAASSVLTICGNFDAASARRQIQQIFADLPKGEAQLAIPHSRQVAPDGELHVLTTTNQVAGIILAAPGMKLADLQDRLAITVLDTIISGYRLPAGWLHTELRGKRLVYVVHAYNWAGLAPGAFVTYAAAEPDNAPEVVRIIRRNLQKASSHRPTQEQIDRAVNVIVTAELLENQATVELALAIALDELYGFGYDYRRRLAEHYGRITPQDVLDAGKKYLSGGFVTIVTTPQPQVFETTGADKN